MNTYYRKGEYRNFQESWKGFIKNYWGTKEESVMQGEWYGIRFSCSLRESREEYVLNKIYLLKQVEEELQNKVMIFETKKFDELVRILEVHYQSETDRLNNSGNRHFFDLTDKQLREKRVFALHFIEKHFVNENENTLIHNAVPVNYKSDQLLYENGHNSGIGVMKSPEKLTLRKNGSRKYYGNSNADSGLSAHFFAENTCQSPDQLTTSENTQNIEVLLDMRTPTKMKRGNPIADITREEDLQGNDHIESNISNNLGAVDGNFLNNNTKQLSNLENKTVPDSDSGDNLTLSHRIRRCKSVL
ncbi:hypothetical protein FQA39_LY13430 [Lamprigera yunnana]|nr:hypothetical protein FQA39_LY13430 [Lamprigera yunnana]